jgi:alpha-L-arabinofuranosidase
MLSRNYLPQLVQCVITGAQGQLDASATSSDDGKTLVLQAVNPGELAVTAQIRITGFVPIVPTAPVTELSGQPDAVNTAGQPEAIVPKHGAWQHGIKEGVTDHTFPPHSFTVMRLE